MTFDIPVVIALCTACLFVGGQLAILAQVVRSNREQGRRLGALEQWKAKREAIEGDRRIRVRTAAGGVPVAEDGQ